MSSTHSEIGPELRQLAQAILDRLDPLVRAAVAATTGRGETKGKCQQVWCPVCALAAVIEGEQHPLLDVISEHSTSLLDAVRAVVEDTPPPDHDGGGQPDGQADGQAEEGDADRPGPGRYQHIPISIDE